MIQDVDESLRALVKRDALNGSKADIAFDAPTREWSSRRNAPTVDLYLYDIREDLEQREVMWEDVLDDNGYVASRRPPPRRFKLSYLVTAWTQRPEDEHRLLSSLLACFIRYPKMPGDLITGPLGESGHGVYLSIALPPPQDRSISDVWSALGGELKPSLDLVINAPVVVAVAEAAGPPVLEEPKFTVRRPDADAETAGRGKARRLAASAKPVGSGGVAGPTDAGRLKPGEPVDKPGVPPDQEELVRSGKEKQPGRILRVRGINRS
jgi:uncharacterized protein DUF4255